MRGVQSRVLSVGGFNQPVRADPAHLSADVEVELVRGTVDCANTQLATGMLPHRHPRIRPGVTAVCGVSSELAGLSTGLSHRRARDCRYDLYLLTAVPLRQCAAIVIPRQAGFQRVHQLESQNVANATDKLNLINNSRLAEGVKSPKGWKWLGDDQAVTWSREPSAGSKDEAMTLRSSSTANVGGWARRVRCKPDEYYRVECLVSCACDASGDADGLVLSMQPVVEGEPADDPVELIAPLTLEQPTRLRAYYHSPENVRSVEVQIGLARAKGVARIHSLTMQSIIEPETESHMLSCPPPPYAYPATKKVKKVTVCSSKRDARPISAILKKRFGAASVTAISADAFEADGTKADAILFPDDLPRGVKKLEALHKLAQTRIVVINLKAFEELSNEACMMRITKQADDSMQAKVSYANFMTRGFAIGDLFPFDWLGPDGLSFIQRQYRTSNAFKDFCKKHEYEVILASMANTDARSDCPICLFKPTPGGGVVVLDVEAAEQTPTNLHEPDLAFYFLLNILGAEQNTLGQYVAPLETEKEFRDQIVELGQRYSALVIKGERNPDKPRRDQIVELGGGDEGFGLPINTRPLIVLRTGLSGNDHDGVYGAMAWLKNLVRHEPFACPYALELLSRFRFAWIPFNSTYLGDMGWHRPDTVEVIEPAMDLKKQEVAAVIDLTAAEDRAYRLKCSDPALANRCRESLGQLTDRFVNNRFFYRAMDEGECRANPESMKWRIQKLAPHIESVGTSCFDAAIHRQALASGASLIRIEFPACEGYFTGQSVWRTDLVAQTLEHVVGLLFGWIAMNRQGKAIKVHAPDQLNGESAQIIRMEGSEPFRKDQRMSDGKPVTLPTASALCIANR